MDEGLGHDDIPPNRMVGARGGVRAKAATNRVRGVGVAESLLVEDGGRTIPFTFDDMMRYHGPHSPAGVAMAFKVMQRAFAELSPDAPTPRRDVIVHTAFRGPGARDGFEAVTRGSPTAATRSTGPWCGPTAAACSRISSSWSPSAKRPRPCCCETVS